MPVRVTWRPALAGFTAAENTVIPGTLTLTGRTLTSLAATCSSCAMARCATAMSCSVDAICAVPFAFVLFAPGGPAGAATTLLLHAANHHADAVVLFDVIYDKKTPVFGTIFEVPLERKDRKRYTWPLY